ncbi:3'-5' exonuclease [Jeongeupia sp. USM3]|uniref:3'-5' exonuclease n=1 Tax=Jeongeupia sp. USM3 TaxID=1906741 RepID=UPI00089DE8BE|nr:3'-5' exonuclease [Jeongeupia sp. USM3]AOY01690.1 DNA polymerase III subunit epsilon [Jeongeupia sp. USM3]
MLAALFCRLNRRRLRDPRFAALFDPPPAGECVSLDCETTSLDARSAELLSIAAVPVRDGRVLLSEKLVLTVRPEGPIDAGTIPIHRLRPQDVAEGLPAHEALARLLDFIGPRPLVGYYLEFDLAIINRHLKPWIGIALPNRAIDVSTLYYDRHVSAYRPEVDLSLDAMLETLQLPRWPRHDALGDAVTAALIYLKLAANRR